MPRPNKAIALFFLVLLAVMLAAGTTALFAADAPGSSPNNGIELSVSTVFVCVPQTIAPGAQMWFRVPYNAGKDLDIAATGADPLNLDVYDPAQAAAFPNQRVPVGRLTVNWNMNGAKNWQGHWADGKWSTFYYVLAANTTGASMTFSMCTQETEQFIPPPPAPPPFMCLSPQVSDGLGGCMCPRPWFDDGNGGCMCNLETSIEVDGRCVLCPEGTFPIEGQCVPMN